MILVVDLDLRPVLGSDSEVWHGAPLFRVDDDLQKNAAGRSVTLSAASSIRFATFSGFRS
jgi:hypothetical protein